MKGTERGPNGTLRHYYCYKEGGPKYYYEKKDTNGWMRTPFRKPFIPKEPEPQGYYYHEPMQYCEYVPGPRLSNMETQFRQLHPNVKKLVETWMLVFGFATVDDINVEDVQKAFRRLSLIHHPDRGGSEEKYKERNSVRDHLITLCTMAQAMG